LPAHSAFTRYGVFFSPDAREFVRLARRSPAEAAQIFPVLRKSAVASMRPPGWCTEFAELLKHGARPAGLPVTREHASRRVRAHFGMSPAAFRAEWRLRRALELVRIGSPLVEAAQAAGYSDQSHMSREIRRATGATPGSHRRGWRG